MNLSTESHTVRRSVSLVAALTVMVWSTVCAGQAAPALAAAPAAEQIGPVTVIGEITAANAGEVIVVDGSGNPVSLPQKGWEHF